MIRNILNNSFSKYLIGGVVAYALKTLISFFLTDILHILYFYSYIFSLFFLIIFNFYLNIHFVFHSNGRKKKMFIQYAIFLLIFTTCDALLVKLFTEVFFLYYIYSIMVSTLLVTMVKFFVYKLIVFRHKNEEITIV